MHEIKIGPVLKRILKARRLRLKEVSQETGIPYSTLHTWYENRSPKDLVRAQLLADYLGISLHELLFDQPDKQQRNQEKANEPLKQPAEDFFKGKFEIIIRRLSD